MLLPVYYRSSLRGDVRKAIENREKGLKRAIAVCVGIYVFLIVSNLFANPNRGMFSMLFTLIGMPVILVAMLFFVKINMVANPKRQFMKAVKTGYPEYYDEFADKK